MLSYVIPMWLHVWQVCWYTQCCTYIMDSDSELYPFASSPSSTCCSWDVPLGLFRNRACPRLISNPLRSSDNVTLNSCRKRDTQSSKGVRASPADALRTAHTFGHACFGAWCSCHLQCMLLGLPTLPGFCLAE